MRLRNIPRAEEVIWGHPAAVKSAETKRGKWNEVFGNSRHIYIEIGMGKGQFILNMAKKHPNINFIGIERYSSVLLRALEKYDTPDYCELKNVRLICMDARDLPQVFAPGEVGRIYLNFSDPWPKARHEKRRLTSPEFLQRYEQVLKGGSRLEFKTDNTELFRFSLDTIRAAKKWRLEGYTYDLHHHKELNQGNIMTEYEEKFSKKGQHINKLIAIYQPENMIIERD